MSDAGAAVLLVGRVIFSLQFVAIAGRFHITQGEMAVGYARQMNFPLASLASWPAGIWLIAGGLSVALGVWGDVGSLMIAVFVILAGSGFHRYWELEDAQQKSTQQLLFWRNVTYLGASIALFAVFTTVGHDLAYTITDPLFDLR